MRDRPVDLDQLPGARGGVQPVDVLGHDRLEHPAALELIKQTSHKGDLDEGIAAEKEAFTKAFVSEDAREGIGAFLGKRTPEFKGK